VKTQTRPEKAKAKTLVAKLIELAEKAYGHVRRDNRIDPLEEMLLLILSDGSTFDRASKAREQMNAGFVDLNEIRVSSPAQIAEVIEGVDNEERKAELVKRFLERLFNHQAAIQFDFLTDLTPAGARAYLEEIDDMPPRVVANMMMRHFGEGALPIDENIHRVAYRVGLLGRMGLDKAEGLLREIVTKRQVFAFHELLENVAQDTCLVSVKHCESCPLASACATAKQTKAKTAAKPDRKTKAKAKPAKAKKAKPSGGTDRPAKKRAKARKTTRATRARSKK